MVGTLRIPVVSGFGVGFAFDLCVGVDFVSVSMSSLSRQKDCFGVGFGSEFPTLQVGVVRFYVKSGLSSSSRSRIPLSGNIQ